MNGQNFEQGGCCLMWPPVILKHLSLVAEKGGEGGGLGPVVKGTVLWY